MDFTRPYSVSSATSSALSQKSNNGHSHVTGPVAVDPEYSRLSDAYDQWGKRYEYNQRIWDSTYGTEIWEGTTNLMTEANSLSMSGAVNVTVTSGQKYAVQCATGSIALSDAGSGNVVPGTSVVITASSTTLTLTGTATYVQVENKAYATPWQTGGTTRAAATLAVPVGATQKNLLTPNQATGGDAQGGMTGFAESNGATVTRDTSEAYAGTGSIKIVAPGTVAYEGVRAGETGSFSTVVGKIYTFSLYAWGSGDLSLGVGGISSGYAPTALSATKQRIQVTFTATSTTAHYLTARTYSTAQAATFWIDALQLEEGTTASDFTLPAVDYSNALIDPAQPFSIEFDAVPWVDDKSKDKYLFAIGAEPNCIFVYSNATSGYYRMYHKNGATLRSILSSVVMATSTKVCHKISCSGSQLTYTINGTDIGTVAFDGLPSLVKWSMYFGSTIDAISHRNCSISNVRIRKGVALTAAERAYTGQLVADQYTTFASNLKETISSRPFVKVNGVGQNVVLAGDSPNQNAFWQGDFRLASRTLPVTDPATGTVIIDGMSFAFNGTGGTKTFSQQTVTNGQQDIPGAVNYLRLVQTAPSGQTTQQYVGKIEDVRTYNGRKVKLILNARCPEQLTLPSIVVTQNFGSGGSTAVTVQTIANVKLLSKISRYKFEFTMPSVAGKTIGAGNHIALTINHPLNAAFTLDFADIELKPADAPDSYYRRDIQMLQQLGARTLQALPANLQLRAVNIQANMIDFESVMLPTQMRATPALSGTYVETTNWKVLSTAGAQTTGFTWALLNASSGQVAFRATKTAHGLTDATLQLVTNILLSAEL